jgi:tetratricopeptide (TPR) repeat protein
VQIKSCKSMNQPPAESLRGWRILSAVPRALFIATVILTGTVSGAAQTPDRLAAGRDEFRAGNFSRAAVLFDEAEAEAPGSTEALLLEGRAYTQLEQYPAAESALRRYLQSHANSDEALYLLGYLLHRQNRAAESLATYTKAARLRAPRGDDLKIVGLNYVLLNDYPDAIQWLEKAVQAEPENKEAWYFLGRAYYSRSRMGEAGTALSKTLKLDPKNSKAENNLGLVLEAEAKIDAALEAYRHAIEWQSQDRHPSEQPYLNLGSLLLDQSRLAEAVPNLQKAVELAPGNAACELKLGTAYLRLEKFQEALPRLEKAVALAPQDAAGHYQLGKLYKVLKMADRARVEFEKTEELQRRAASTATKPN